MRGQRVHLIYLTCWLWRCGRCRPADWCPPPPPPPHQAALELGKQPYHQLSPGFHLRLLHTLCNDVLQCYLMKEELLVRLDITAELTTLKYHKDAEVCVCVCGGGWGGRGGQT